MLGDEELAGFHRLRSGAAHAQHVPVVHDLVLAARDETHPVIDDALAVAHHDGQHVPVGHVHPAREVPEAAHDEAPVHAAPAPLRVGDAGRDQGFGILAPDLLLSALVVEGEHPVVNAEVGDVPGGRGAAAADLGGEIEDRLERELHPTPGLRLVKAEQPGAVQILERFLLHLAPDLRAVGPLAQDGDEGAGSRHRLVVRHVGEARRPGHALIPATCGIFE